MQYLNRVQLRDRINDLAGVGEPFLFLVDYRGERGLVSPLAQLAESGIYCSIDGVEYGRMPDADRAVSHFQIAPIPFDLYSQSFDRVKAHIAHGDSYLLNLTFATPLSGNLDLRSIYARAQSKYKFMIEDQFLFYSPEPFVRIKGDKIYSFPMKGTVDALEDSAEQQLLGSQKELCEHYTIVDLIRNDLSMVARDVQVEKFRYVEKITTERSSILQTSSCISGTLPDDWSARLGDILLTLLPAGSITGAPKERTVEIIEEVEMSSRGFYTGVMGIFRDGVVDSCVNIRFIEKSGDQFFYHSGGGITSRSDAQTEYRELQTKIYVPVI